MILSDEKSLKVAITGHSQGIGKAFADWFSSRGHSVVGLSRGNGYDIQDTNQIINRVKDCDIFINNAWQAFDQSMLMYQLHQEWFGDQQKLIVAVSSARTIKPTEYYNANPVRNLYKTSKQSLEESCTHLWNHNPYPRICVFKPGHTDTPFTSKSVRPKMDADQLVNYFMSCIKLAPSGMFVQEICIREQHNVEHLRDHSKDFTG
jgi:short-subunit dehydrogenase